MKVLRPPAKKAPSVQDTPLQPELPRFVGRASCTTCHPTEAKAYEGSQHDCALEVPSAGTVAAPFAGEKLKGAHMQATFKTADGKATIESGGSHRVQWVIGVEPLQQYLVQGERGRVQTFSAAYDVRPKTQGGERWYFIEEVDVPEGDALHWKGDALNWNFMCADCHSTNVQKNYNFEQDSYNTSFSELDVSCEACHGPASRHVDWAQEQKKTKDPFKGKFVGFSRSLRSTARKWVRRAGEKIAHLEGGDPSYQEAELNGCAPCHSRRADLGGASGGEYFDRYRLRLLDAEMYFSDGQIQEEVYVFGSFLQSKMYGAGVTCSDCHEPHAGTLRAPQETICLKCHDAENYNRASHTMHEAAWAQPNEPLPLCVDCHMPTRTYMGVDDRRDHRFGIPRPRQSQKISSPQACANCHQEKGSAWAARAIEKVHGPESPSESALALFAAKNEYSTSNQLLAALVANEQESPIMRATGLMRLSEQADLGREFVDAVLRSGRSSHVLLRTAAAEASGPLPPELKLPLLRHLWKDSLRTVRIAGAMAAISIPHLSPEDESKLRVVLLEAKSAREYESDRISGVLALASIEARLGHWDRSFELYSEATRRFQISQTAYVNWADALRSRHQEKEAGAVLADGLARFENDAALNHARGLWLVRQKRYSQALPVLKKAYKLALVNQKRRYGYVYAIALSEGGNKAEAIILLKQLQKASPQAREISQALHSMIQ